MRNILLGLVVLLFTGCYSTTAIVSRGEPADPKVPKPNKELPGVPFYPTRAVCKHQTVWMEPVFSLTREDTYSAKAPEKPAVITQVKLARISDLGPKLTYLTNLQSAIATQVKINDAWARIGTTGALTFAQPPSATDVFLGSNSVTSVKYVDYETPFYFNTRMPIIGSSTAKANLNDDGTLGGIEATSAPKTAETLLSLLPINAFFSATLGLPAPKSGGGGPGSSAAMFYDSTSGAEALNRSNMPMQVTLTIATAFYKHTLTSTAKQVASPCEISPKLQLADYDKYEYQWEAVPSSAQSNDDGTDTGKTKGTSIKGATDTGAKDEKDKKKPNPGGSK
jgi:hypothetical protein